MNNDTPIKPATIPVTRSARGLVDALFTTIDRLNAKQIDAEEARAVSHTARTIVQIARLELEVRKHQVDNDDAVPLLTLQVEGSSPPES